MQVGVELLSLETFTLNKALQPPTTASELQRNVANGLMLAGSPQDVLMQPAGNDGKIGKVRTTLARWDLGSSSLLVAVSPRISLS